MVAGLLRLIIRVVTYPRIQTTISVLGHLLSLFYWWAWLCWVQKDLRKRVGKGNCFREAFLSLFICDEDLWQGIAKSAEGHLSGVLWAKAKEEGLKVEVSWLDADSSSAKGFRQLYSNEQESRIMLCESHVGRAHGKKLEELITKSSFSSTFIALHKREFPSVESVKCRCVGKNHTFVAAR